MQATFCYMILSLPVIQRTKTDPWSTVKNRRFWRIPPVFGAHIRGDRIGNSLRSLASEKLESLCYCKALFVWW